MITRAVDIVLGLVGSILTAPVVAVLALAIRIVPGQATLEDPRVTSGAVKADPDRPKRGARSDERGALPADEAITRPDCPRPTRQRPERAAGARVGAPLRSLDGAWRPRCPRLLRHADSIRAAGAGNASSADRLLCVRALAEHVGAV